MALRKTADRCVEDPPAEGPPGADFVFWQNMSPERRAGAFWELVDWLDVATRFESVRPLDLKLAA